MKKVTIGSISDIHGYLNFAIPNVDILTISGDICPYNMSHNPDVQFDWINKKFIPWCYELLNSNNVKYIVFTPGNHDFIFEKEHNYPTDKYKIRFPKNVYCLIDEYVEIENLKIYGTPWSVRFGNWAFMNSEFVLDNMFNKIPNNVDILLSHSPIQDYNDVILQNGYNRQIVEHLGSNALKKRIFKVKPKYILVGHIHSGSHEPVKILYNDLDKYSISVNVSLLDEAYRVFYKPYIFEITI